MMFGICSTDNPLLPDRGPAAVSLGPFAGCIAPRASIPELLQFLVVDLVRGRLGQGRLEGKRGGDHVDGQVFSTEALQLDDGGALLRLSATDIRLDPHAILVV